MRLGAVIPNAGEVPGRLGIARMAQASEEAGADAVWVSDHLCMVDVETTDYPYSADGRPTWDVTVDYYEAFACCSFMAAATEKVRVGTAVLVLPQRNVLEVAKVAASIDQLSGGRLSLGVGAGWYSAEFEALGYSYASRGARLAEMLVVLRDCWGGHPAAYSGRHVSVPPNVVLRPRPAQPEGPPLLVGGMTKAAIRRAAELGDGWLPIAFVESLDLEQLRKQLSEFELQWSRAGRSKPKPATVLLLHSSPEAADRLPELVVEIERLGFDEVIIEPPWSLGLDAGRSALAAVRSALR